MKVHFLTSTIQPMLDWLHTAKHQGIRDEEKLRRILSLPDYQIEFARYGMKGLPVCGITYEEAVDFFLHFDSKDFENPRLQYKKQSFIAFYEHLEERIGTIEKFSSLSEDDCAVIEDLLKMGLPDAVVGQIDEISIILIVSIGNSMGWPYGSYVDYDVACLDCFASMKDFLHVTAHEIHHLYVGQMLGQEGISPEGFFLQNFAYEGLAVHYNNNLGTWLKPRKYIGPTYEMNREDMDFYEAHFDEIFALIQQDYQIAKSLSLEEVSELVSSHYEQFEFMGKKIRQYPTYYFGCFLWGTIDYRYGKEKLYEALANPELFVELFNAAMPEKYRLI